MDDFQDLAHRVDRMEQRIDRLTKIRQLLEAEIDDILENAAVDLTALKLELTTERYEGRHENETN